MCAGNSKCFTAELICNDLYRHHQQHLRAAAVGQKGPRTRMAPLGKSAPACSSCKAAQHCIAVPSC